MKSIILTILIISMLMLTACSVNETAVAVIHPTQGNQVLGLVKLTQMGSQTVVQARVSGLSPGAHGFHIHQYGDCTAVDGTSAGGHFNPQEVPHAGPDAHPKHVGDLGNLVAGEDGVAVYEAYLSGVSLTGKDSVIGRAFIVHEKVDDLTSQPTGAAGARLGCGVIGIGK